MQSNYYPDISFLISIDQAHQPDEFITLEQVAEGWTFMQRVAEVLR